MSQYYAYGIHPDTGNPVRIVYGYDEVPGYLAGYFFQVYLTPQDPAFIPDEENCILNEGYLDGLPESVLDILLKKYQVSNEHPFAKKHWI